MWRREEIMFVCVGSARLLRPFLGCPEQVVSYLSLTEKRLWQKMQM